jgi:hypothetical protein
VDKPYAPDSDISKESEQLRKWREKQEAEKRYLETTFSSFEIMRALLIEKEKLRDWIDRGFIKASKPSPGRGKPAAFSVKDIYGLALFMELINHGFPRERAAYMVERYHFATEYEDFTGDGETAVFEEPADFILFRRETDNQGNLIIKAITIQSDNSVISLLSGEDVSCFDNGIIEKIKSQKPRDWNSMLVINYKKIREAVDEALKKL